MERGVVSQARRMTNLCPGNRVRYNLSKLFACHGFNVIRLQTYFPEYWDQNIQRRLLKWCEFFADRLTRAGDNIELIASVRQKP